MEPLSEYREKRTHSRRRLLLFSDKIVIKGVYGLSTEYESTIELATLQPHYDTIRTRESIFNTGLWMIFISGLYFAINRIFGYNLLWGYLALLFLGLPGLSLSLLTLRKVQFARFKSDSWALVLDIAKSGKDRKKFDSFVNQVLEQIKQSKSKAQQLIAADASSGPR
jgi:hypothetical protein